MMRSLTRSAWPALSLVLLVLALANSPLCSGQTIAAAYTASNAASGNQLIISSISATGSISYSSTTSTGGLGAVLPASGVSTLGLLFSQDSLVVDQARGVLFVANAGSNSVSLFAINATNPTQVTLQAVLSTGFVYPVSIALASNHSLACVLNGGSGGGVRCYNYTAVSNVSIITAWDRSLNLANIVLAQPLSPFNTTGDITFTADQSALIIAVRSNGVSSGSLLTFPINYATNTLAASPLVQVPEGSVLPFSLTLVGANTLLVTDPGFAGISLLMYTSASGLTNAATTPPVGNLVNSSDGALCWSRYSPSTGFYFLIGTGVNGTIVGISVNVAQLTATVLSQTKTQPLAEALDMSIATIGGRDFLYVIGPAAQVIIAYAVQANGQLTSVNTATLPGLTISQLGLAVFIAPPSPAVSRVLGDPQFVGLRGQSYQVHGIHGQVYNLILDHGMWVNSRFIFLSSGRCPAGSSARSPCWSHPGSYLGEVGVATAAGDELVVISGAVDTGFASVTLHSQALKPSPLTVNGSALSVRYTSASSLVVTVGNFELSMENGDFFINLVGVRVLSWSALSSGCHGLLGQTWNAKRPRGVDVAEVEGAVDDYTELNNELLGHEFGFIDMRRAA